MTSDRILSSREVGQLFKGSGGHVSHPGIVKDLRGAITPDRKPRTDLPYLKRMYGRPRKIAPIPLSYEMLYEIAEKSYIARMVVWAIVRECTRKTVKGLRRFWDFVPNFVLQCSVCGEEYQEETDRCRCGSTSFIRPDPAQLVELRKLLANPNATYSFGDIVKRCLYDAQVVDDWYISIGYDDTHSVPRQLWYEDPRYIHICADDKGMLGNGEYFCPIHTRRDPEKSYTKEERVCPEMVTIGGVRQPCGHELLETAYMQIIDNKVTARFARDEMMHGNSYGVGTRLYGSSNLRSLIVAVATHMAIDNYGYDAFSMQREPNSALVFMGTDQDSVDSQADTFRAARAENPYAQLWLGLKEGQALEYVKMLDSVSNAQTIAEREFYRSVFCSVYGVSPIFVAVETPGKLGTANDFQIHVQNNTTESNQDQFAEQVNRDLVPLMKISHWHWDFVPVEPEDEKLAAEVLNIRAQAAKTAADAGFDVHWDADGVHITGEGSRPPAAPAPGSFGLSASATRGMKSLCKSEEHTDDAPLGIVTPQDKWYRDAVKAFEASIESSVSRMATGMSEAQMKRLIDAELAVLEIRLGRKARDFVEAEYKKGLAQAGRDLHLEVAFDGTDADAIDYLIGQWHGVRTSLPEFTSDQRAALSSIIQEAYSTPGKFNLEEMKAEMRAVVDVEKYKLERIARTETTYISNNGRAQGYLKDPEKANRLYRWSVAPDACERCNEIANMGPMPLEKLRELTNGFVVHPNDRCTVVLHVEGL